MAAKTTVYLGSQTSMHIYDILFEHIATLNCPRNPLARSPTLLQDL